MIRRPIITDFKVTQQEWDPETNSLKYTYGGPGSEKRAPKNEARPDWTDPNIAKGRKIDDVINDALAGASKDTQDEGAVDNQEL